MAATTTPVDPQLAARRRLADMRRRTRQLRLWVACASVTLFIAVFTLIYVQMGVAARSPTASSGAAPVLSAAASSSPSSTSMSSSAATSGAQRRPAPVVTQQS